MFSAIFVVNTQHYRKAINDFVRRANFKVIVGARIMCKPCVEHYTDGPTTPEKA